MARSSRLPALLLAFLVPFGAGAAGAYLIRSGQLKGDGGFKTNVVAAPDTTVVDTTLLSVDTSAVDTSAAPETTVVTTTEAPTTEAATTIPAPRSTPSLSTDGSLLQPIGATERRLYSDADGCDSLAAGGAADGCDRLDIGGVQIAWVIADGGIDVLQRDPAVDGPDVWNVVLHANSAPSRDPVVADVTGDGQPELAVGWRNSKRTLAVDVVEVRDGNPGVSLHLDLIDGRISVGDGQIDAWNGVPQAGDDPDTPSSFDHWTITRPGGRWRVNSQRDDHPPSGQL